MISGWGGELMLVNFQHLSDSIPILPSLTSYVGKFGHFPTTYNYGIAMDICGCHGSVTCIWLEVRFVEVFLWILWTCY